MTSSKTITLFHSPKSRSSGALTLLEELKVPYELHLINMKAGEQRQPPYMAINPLGKVPAIWHRGQLITEQIAIFLYLADLFPEAGLAPAFDDPLRGPYLRWMVYYAACYEPALVDKAMKREPTALAMSPYGTFDLMLGNIVNRLTESPYLLGDKLSAADLQWGGSLKWGTMFGLVPEEPVLTKYIAEITSRPAFIKVAEMDTKWAAEHEAVVKAKAGG
jgi:glutathione S-transferase